MTGREQKGLLVLRLLNSNSWLEEAMLTWNYVQGSGKTTQIPQFLEQAGWCEGGKIVAVTQVGEFEKHLY